MSNATAAARKPRTAKSVKAAAPAANLPAIVANVPAIVPGAAPASALPATVAPGAAKPLPAAHNGAGWLALFEALPAWGEMLAEMRAHKYGKGKGLVPAANTMFSLTAYGVELAEKGSKKNGAPNAQAATCRAAALAIEATGESKVCGAAIVYYMLTAESVLVLLRQCKATKYVGKTGTPAPAWCNGYVTGNAREEMLVKHS